MFLILIAGALFAALSYAITNSSRGGGNIDKEQAEILAAQIFDQVATIRTAHNRLSIIGNYDQIQFNDAAANNAGTCYSSFATTSPCSTIGVFSSEAGLSPPIWTDEMRDPAFPAETNQWVWYSRRTQIGGVEIGTTSADEYLYIHSLSSEICNAINKKINGDPAIGAVSAIGDTSGYARNYATDGVYTSIAVAPPPSGLDFDHEGCVVTGGFKTAFFLVKAN